MINSRDSTDSEPSRSPVAKIGNGLPAWVFEGEAAAVAPSRAPLKSVVGDEPASRLAPFQLLTIAEAARLLRVSMRTVRRQIAAGELTPVRIGRSVRISDAELVDYISGIKAFKYSA